MVPDRSAVTNKAVAIVEAWQVELQGRYSLPRFREVLNHAKTTTWVSHFAMLLITPVPSLLLTIGMDALPVEPPGDGIAAQTAWLYVRVFIVGWIMSHMIAMQIHQSAPSLPLSTRQLWSVSVGVGLTCMPWFYGLGSILGFPTPFFLLFLCPDSVPVFVVGLWATWKDTLRVDALARANIKRYLPVFVVQVSMVYVYSFYGIAFNKLDKNVQPIMAFGLPVIKLLFKNIVSKGVFHMEDLAPTTIVFNVDVFHALFISGSMQQSASSGTTWTIMIVDAVQFGVAYYEVHTVLRRVQQLAVEIAKNTGDDDGDAGGDNGGETAARTGHRNSTFSRVASQTKLKLGVIDYAMYVIDTCPLIHDHPQVALPRHLRQQAMDTPVAVPVASLGVHPSQVVPVALPLAAGGGGGPAEKDTVPVQPTRLSKLERLQLESVTSVLKMLHMIEFYVLIEFTEVAVATLYTLYMWALLYLPNRAYYQHLSHLTETEMRAMVSRLALYSFLELVSFVLFCIVLNRKLRHISTIQQLAFVLRKHALVALTTMAMWVFYVPQVTFEHFGADYTFQFKWLHGSS